MTEPNDKSIPLIGVKSTSNDGNNEKNELSDSDRQQTFASERDTIYFPSTSGGENVALHSEFDEKISFIAPPVGPMHMQGVMSLPKQNMFSEYMETLNYDKKYEVSSNVNSSSSAVSPITSNKDSNNESVSPEDENQQFLELDYDLFEFAFKITRSIFQLNESTGVRDVLIDINIECWPKRSSTDSMKSEYNVRRWYGDIKCNHDKLELSGENVTIPSIDIANFTDGCALCDDDQSKIQEYFSVMASLMSNNEIFNTFLSFLDDGSSSLLGNVKIASLESRLMQTVSLCNDLNSRLRKSEKNYSQMNDLISILRCKLENIEGGTKPIQRVNSVSTTMVSDDFQSMDSISSSNLFQQRTQNNWNRNAPETTSPTIMTTDGMKFKAYNKDPHLLNQPSSIQQQQHFGYCQDEPFFSNNKDFWDIFPQTLKSSVIDAQIDQVLNFVQPNVTAEKGRNSIIFFLIQKIELILGFQPENYYPTGDFAIKCYLPDESSQIAFFIHPDKQRNWVETILYGLQQMCKQSNDMNTSAIHALTEVTFHPYGDVLSICCQVDGQTVNIFVNDVKRLRDAAYLEHCNTLIAKQHLFKQSFILLKAWWRYESGIQCFSDMALPVMLLAIINKYHRIVFSPFQVLSLFFQYYADFEWQDRWISIERIGHFNALCTERSEDGYSTSFSHDGLISRDVVEKYRTAAEKPTYSPVSGFPMLSNNFISSSINIVDPFSKDNIAYGTVNQEIHLKLTSSIKETAQKISNILGELKNAENLEGKSRDWIKECFESIFHNTLTHFTHKPRRDCIHNNRHVPLSQQYLSSIDPFHVDHFQLCENLKMARQILGNEVSTTVLVSLTESILSEKGPLPVGEVGKMLQEATANPHLSQTLKDKHNGLKKFLEKFSELFIMSNDHPFNPHVYLRSNFTIQEQRLLEAGNTEILAAFKKAKKNRRKAKGPLSYHMRGYN